MKASPQHQQQLLKLAGIDAAWARLQHTAKHLPEQEHLAALEDERRQRRAATAVALGELEDAQSQLRRITNDLDTVIQRHHADEAALTKASSQKEIHAYELELESLARRRERLEDEQFEVDEQVAVLTQRYEQERERMRELEDQARDLLTRRDAARENLKAEAKELSVNRKTLVAGLPTELVKVYEHARERSGVGAAELVGRVSMASNETLETADLEHIRRAAADDVVFCPATGAVLVRTERSEA